MALRRRLFWSCYCIDKFASAGTSRTQCFSRGDVKPNTPSISESLLLRDRYSESSVTDEQIVNDSLVDVSRYYMKIVELFGEVNAIMSRAKTDSTSAVVWPPVAEYSTLDANLQIWKESLPKNFHFTPSNLEYHTKHAGKSYFNIWLSMHAVWSSSLMVLHRGSLAYGDIRPEDVSDRVYGAIQLSIETCKEGVRTATEVFKAMRDYFGYNVLPFMGYSAYIFSTLLMTSTFSKGPDACQKSQAVLKILYDLIDVSTVIYFIQTGSNSNIYIQSLRPYWPLCERLANATKDLLAAHNRLYQPSLPSTEYKLMQPQQNTTSNYNPVLSAPASNTTDYSLLNTSNPYYNQPASNITSQQPQSQSLSSQLSASLDQQQRQQQQQQQPVSFSNILNTDFGSYGDIDFNSLGFLNDSGWFGQIVFDASRSADDAFPMTTYPTMQNFLNTSTSQQPPLIATQAIYTPTSPVSSEQSPWTTTSH